MLNSLRRWASIPARDRCRRKPRVLSFEPLEQKQVMASASAVNGAWKVVVEDYNATSSDRDIRAKLYQNNILHRSYSVTTSTFDEYEPQVSINPSGNFAVVYMYKNGDIDLALKAYTPSSSKPWLDTRVASSSKDEWYALTRPVRIGSQNHIFVVYNYSSANVNSDVKIWRSHNGGTKNVAATSEYEARGEVTTWAASGSWADVTYYTFAGKKSKRIYF